MLGCIQLVWRALFPSSYTFLYQLYLSAVSVRRTKMCMTGHAMLAVCAGMCLLFRFVPRSQNWRDKVVAMEAVAQTIGNEAVEELGRLPTVAEPDDRPAELECDHFSMRWSFLYSDACISFIDWYAFAPLAVHHCLWLSRLITLLHNIILLQNHPLFVQAHTWTFATHWSISIGTFGSICQ